MLLMLLLSALPVLKNSCLSVNHPRVQGAKGAYTHTRGGWIQLGMNGAALVWMLRGRA